MKYLKAIKEQYDRFTGYTTVYGELVTPRERSIKFRHLPDECFIPVEVKRNNIVFMFGCRYEHGTAKERRHYRMQERNRVAEKTTEAQKFMVAMKTIMDVMHDENRFSEIVANL